MFKKILIANRGEIAVRIIRTLRDMGITTVALYVESDSASLHVLLADEAARLSSAQGYTDGQEIIRLALLNKVDAIHAGYGFLAESPEFSQACAAANLVFIGPPAEALQTCTSKFDMLKMAASCGMKILEHSKSAFSPEALAEISKSALEIGFPVHVKAFKGTGRRAARIAGTDEELKRSVELSSREAQANFADNRIYLEKAIPKSRTLQLQFLCDRKKVVFLGLVDVSMHRHNARFLAETPAPKVVLASLLFDGVGAEAAPLARGSEAALLLTGSAEALIKKVGYCGLGALEFLLDKDGTYYFLELQARIQIEHSAIELLTGLDLVQEQIRIASGLALGDLQPKREGVAMQCRIYAEDLLHQSLPSPGVLSRFRLAGGPNIRVDAYGYGGCRIPAQFDPLLATIASWGATRAECIARMKRALRDTAITGVKTNLARIQTLLHDDEFVCANYDNDTAKGLQKLCFSNNSDDKLAAIAAIAFCSKTQRAGMFKAERLSGGWHASSRNFDD